MTKILKGGTFNLLYGRDQDTVKKEVERFLNKHGLDFLVVEEASGYFHILNSIEGYDYIYDKSEFAGFESAILVRDTLKHDRQRFVPYGNGWFRVTGRGKLGPRGGMNQVRIDGWLYVRSLHLPTPSFWKNGKIDTSKVPAGRVDDIVAAANTLLRYFTFPSRLNGRIAVGDWNEAPADVGKYSPGWVARKTGAKTWHPQSKAGHGWIDWVMGKGVRISVIFKDLVLREGSDHEPVVFVVVKS